MSRKQDTDPITVIGAADKQNYLGLVQEHVADSTLPKYIAITWIYQFYDMTDNYIGAAVVVDSLELVRKSSGPEPSFRKWIVVDAEWNEYIANDISMFYHYVARHLVQPVGDQFIYKYDQFYQNSAMLYEQMVQRATMNVTGYANR